MPHFGHVPGVALSTSGCIGQVKPALVGDALGAGRIGIGGGARSGIDGTS